MAITCCPFPHRISTASKNIERVIAWARLSWKNLSSFASSWMLKHKADFALAYQVLLLMQALLCLVRQTICGPSPSQHSPTTAPDQQVASVPDPHPRWACLLALADNRIWSQAFLWHSVAHIGIRWTKVASKDDCHHIDGSWKQFKSRGDAQYVIDTS